MRDRIVPGGVSTDVGAEGLSAIRAAVEEVGSRLPALVDLYDNTTSLQDRTALTGILKPALARQYAAGGYVGRASGRNFDARKAPGYAPYDGLDFSVPTLEGGDVDARVWIRIREIEQSLSLIAQLLGRLPLLLELVHEERREQVVSHRLRLALEVVHDELGKHFSDFLGDQAELDRLAAVLLMLLVSERHGMKGHQAPAHASHRADVFLVARG